MNRKDLSGLNSVSLTSGAGTFGAHMFGKGIGKKRLGNEAIGLASKAGTAPEARAIEALEARQLLFALTADPYSLLQFGLPFGTGAIGAGLAGASISANYFVPIVRQQISQFTAGTPITQNFDADLRTLDGILSPQGPRGNNTVAPGQIGTRPGDAIPTFNFRPIPGTDTAAPTSFVQLRHFNYGAATPDLSPSIVTGNSTSGGAQLFFGVQDDQSVEFRLPTGTFTSTFQQRSTGLSGVRQAQFTTPNLFTVEDFNTEPDPVAFPNYPLISNQTPVGPSNIQFDFAGGAVVPSYVVPLAIGGGGGTTGGHIGTVIGAGVGAQFGVRVVQVTDPATVTGPEQNVSNTIARLVTRFRFRTPGFAATTNLDMATATPPLAIDAAGTVLSAMAGQLFAFRPNGGATANINIPAPVAPATVGTGLEVQSNLAAGQSVSAFVKGTEDFASVSRIFDTFTFRNNNLVLNVPTVNFGVQLLYRGTVVQTLTQGAVAALQNAAGNITLARAAGFDEVRYTFAGNGQLRVDDFTASGRGTLDPATQVQLVRDGVVVDTRSPAQLATAVVALTPYIDSTDLNQGREYRLDLAAGFDEVRFLHTAAGGLASSGVIIDDIKAQAQGELNAGTIVELVKQGRVVDTYTAVELNASVIGVADFGTTPDIAPGQVGRVTILGAARVPGEFPGVENLPSFRYAIGRRDNPNTPTNESAVETFETIRIRRDGSVGLDDAGIIIDDMALLQPPGRFNTFTQTRVRTAQFAFTGLDNDLTGGLGDGVTFNNGRLRGVSAVERFNTGAGVPAGQLTANQILINPDSNRLNIALGNYLPGDRPSIDPSGQSNELAAQLTGTQTISFSYLDDRGAPRPLTNFSFIAGASGLDDGTQVELIRNGRVIRTFSSADLQNLAVQFANPAPGVNDPAGQVFLFDTQTNVSAADPDAAFTEFDVGFEEAITNFSAAFDTVRLSRVGGAGTDAGGINIDRIGGYFPAMAEVFDLYGRPFHPTLRAGEPEGVVPYLLGDANDDGVPEYNDGIGRIVLSNTQTPRNLRGIAPALGAGTANLTVYGATAGDYNEPTDSFAGAGINATIGNLTDLETAGRFGYFIRNDGTNGIVFGLPNGTGSVVIGSPFVRDNRDPILYHGVNPAAQVMQDLPSSFPVARGSPAGPLGTRTGGGFTDEVGRPAGPGPAPLQLIAGPPFRRIPVNYSGQPIEDALAANPIVQIAPGQFLVPNAAPSGDMQGIFSAVGQSVGDITVHGIVHGTSHIFGSARRFAVGYLPGSVLIDGDVGLFSVASDSGGVYIDDNQPNGPPDFPPPGNPPRPLEATGARIFIIGAVRQMQFGGRNLSPVTVLNDQRDPNIAHTDFIRYQELEQVLGINPASQTPEADYNAGSFGAILGGGRAVVPYGTAGYRNGYLDGAEYVGSPLRAVTINGSIGASDAISATDQTDIFAFTAIGCETISLSASFFPPPASSQAALQQVFVRIVNADGRTLVSNQFSFLDAARTPNQPVSVQLSFTPDQTDTYYIVLSADPPQNTPQNPDLTYQIQLSGIAPVSLGSYKSGAKTYSLIDVRGDVGRFVTGAQFQGEDEAIVLPAPAVIQTSEDVNAFLGYQSTLNVTGSVRSLRFAGDLVNATFNISGDLGRFQVGGFFGSTPLDQVDVESLVLNVGGSIGSFLVSGALAGDSNTDNAPTVAGPVVINTGTAGGPGNIGQFIVGEFIAGIGTTIRTSDNSVIGRFVTPRIAVGNPTINMGIGSDIRFAEIGQISTGFANSSPPVENSFQVIAYDQTYSITDDSGSVYRIKIDGGNISQAQASFATIVFLPIQGSQGVAIAGLNANLTGGASLVIEGQSGGRVGIGRLTVAATAGSTLTNSSSIRFRGSAEVDVFRLDATGTYNSITNTTVGGDIVVADVETLNSLSITRGNLGYTDLPNLSLCDGARYGVELGLVVADDAAAQAVGDPIVIPAGVLNPLIGDGAGGIFTPFNPGADNAGTDDPTLEDIGAPGNVTFNGLVVRQGGIQNISVAGAVGDVNVMNGTIVRMTVNDDRITAPGGYDGIRGVVAAAAIGIIDVGDGLKSVGNDSFADAGIFATGVINRIIGGTRYAGVRIEGVIIGFGGVNSVSLTNGIYDGAYIAAATWDSYWYSARRTNPPQLDALDAPVDSGTVGSVIGTNSPFFRSTVFGTTINNVQITNAAFDASTIEARGLVGIGTVSALEFKNSTQFGEPLEFRQAQILSASNIRSITAVRDITDLYVDAQAGITQGIVATNFTRANIQVDATLSRLDARGSIRSSQIVSGRADSITARNDIRSTSVRIAGRITTLTAGGDITNTEILSSGPDGRITTLRAGGDFTGSISSSGPIGTIQAGRDINGSIVTTDSNDGTIGTIRAGRDMAASVDALTTVTSITAGRNIGDRPGSAFAPRDSIAVSGNIGSITAAGAIYSYITVSGNVTGSISMGRVNGTPTGDLVSEAYIDVFGRIPSVVITGDFGGSILSRSGGIGSVKITNGSFRRGFDVANPNRIEARDGDIGSITVTGGSIFGNIIARDGSIGTISVTAVGGLFGDIGINPDRSAATAVPGDLFRNQLPPGVTTTAGIDGPTISAGRDIGTVSVAGGVFESTINAGRTLTSVNVGASGIRNDAATGAGVLGSFIAAGDTITGVNVTGPVTGLHIIAGVTALGTDNAFGGVGAAADTVKSGKIGNVTFRAGSTNTKVTAGMTAGADGVYNTADDAPAAGISTVGNVAVTTGAAVTTSVFADTAIGTTAAGITRGFGTGQADARVYTGATAGATFTPLVSGVVTTVTVGADSATIRFTGTGQTRAVYDSATRRLILFSADGSPVTVTGVVVDSAAAQLTNFNIVTTDDVSVTSLEVKVPLRGTSSLYVDGNISTLRLENVTATGGFGAGGAINTVTIGLPGTVQAPAAANTLGLSAATIGTLTVNGDFGTSATHRIDTLSITTLTVNGAFRGVASVARDITTVTINGILNAGRIRAGGNITTFRANSASLGRVSAGGNIGTINVNGDVTDTPFHAGVDLGTDANFGGVGTAADVISAGNIGTVTIRGNFIRSDVAAGVSRGADGFVNTGDDQVADGRSTVGTVTINGSQVGSVSGSQQYAVISTGGNGITRVNRVTVGGGNFGNFNSAVTTIGATPLRVNDLRVAQSGPGLFRATISFNQAITGDTLAAALSISAVRVINGVTTLIPLTAGVDYTARYVAASRSAVIDFSAAITQADLAGDTQTDSVAGPGIFRFTLDAGTIRGQSTGSNLDGNSDGALTGAADDFVGDALVGDAGDRLFSGTTADGITFYGPTSLDALMDNDRGNTDNLADTNRRFTVRGFAGDHPDSDPVSFDSGGDVDIYSVSLRAGQILRLSAITGSATGLGLAIISSDDTGLVDNQGILATSAQLQRLFSADPNATGLEYLVTVTGVYNIVLLPNVADLLEFNPFGAFAASDSSTAVGAQPAAGTSGDYSFDITIADDGDNGFYGSAGVDTAAASRLVTFDDFAGLDMVLGTADDLKVALIDDLNGANPQFAFQIYLGADGTLGTDDDEFRGGNGVGFYVRQTAGADLTLNTVDDVQTVTRDALAGSAPVDPDGGGPLLAVPVAANFAGVDTILGTADDVRTVTRASTTGGTFTYRLIAGPNGSFTSADAIVRGTDGAGTTSSRASGLDGAFGTGDDLIRTTGDAGDGTLLAGTQVTRSDFAGTDGIIGNADDTRTFTRDGVTFTITGGANNALTFGADDIITASRVTDGTTAAYETVYTAGTDGLFGTGDDVATSTIRGAIGDPGSVGVPSTAVGDVDIYHLNDGGTIAAGTRVRVTLKVGSQGGNLGILQPVFDQFGNVRSVRVIDNRGAVQLGIFDTSLAGAINDGALVAASGDLSGAAGTPSYTVGNSLASYGVDNNGDFFIEYATPQRQDAPTRSGTFAAYVQGVVQTDYTLEVKTVGSVTTLPAAPLSQNVLVDFGGGTVNFIQANPYKTTSFEAFDAESVGLAINIQTGPGEFDVVSATQYIRDQTVLALQAAFDAAGLNVIVSANPGDFEGQDYSSVFVTSSDEPPALFGNGQFGVTQRVDIFNANANDQAVVFANALTVLGDTPDRDGVDSFVTHLSTAVGRRIGELVGLRANTAENNGAAPDIMASNSVATGLAGGFQNFARPLSGQGDSRTDTDFFLGVQNTASLLQRIFFNP